jgi:hypothetical protein
MIPCDFVAGEFAAGTANDSCSVCPDGKYCQTASDPPVYAETSCPAGRYCTLDKVTACPAGTYQDETEKSLLSECNSKPCGQGYACYPLTKKYSCAAGFDCEGTNATTPKPFTEAHGGRMCLPGEYCQSGTGGDPDACSIGKYCSEYMASSYTDNCYAGYYCN